MLLHLEFVRFASISTTYITQVGITPDLFCFSRQVVLLMGFGPTGSVLREE